MNTHPDWDQARRVALQRIKDRYFRSVEAYPDGHVCHHADCECYNSLAVHHYAPCTCGFNHDLAMLDVTLALKLNPALFNNQRRHYLGIFFEPHKPQEIKERLAEINRVFDVPLSSIADTEAQDEHEWSLICTVFGPQCMGQLQSLKHDSTCQECGWTWNSRQRRDCEDCAARAARSIIQSGKAQ